MLLTNEEIALLEATLSPLASRPIDRDLVVKALAHIREQDKLLAEARIILERGIDGEVFDGWGTLKREVEDWLKRYGEGK